MLATSPYAYWSLGETTGPAIDLASSHDATFVPGTPVDSLVRGDDGAPLPGASDGAIRLNDQSNLDGSGGLGGYVSTGMTGVWDGRGIRSRSISG